MNGYQNTTYSAFRKNQNSYASSFFIKKGFKVHPEKKYILSSRNNWPQNIISSDVAKDIELKKQFAGANNIPFPLHRYLHHGLSSQAMLFNLFGEPLLKKDYSFFQEVFNFPDIQIDFKYELKFEHYSKITFNENAQQPTSFDFAVWDESGKHKNIFLEAKYIETEFGGCSVIEGGECEGLNPISNPSMCHLTQKGRNYWYLMKKYELDKPYANSPICPLAIYYQFYRELMFALENSGYFVILIDKRNPAFEKESLEGKRGLIPVLRDRIPSICDEFIKVIYIQDVLPLLEKHGYGWVNEFREKYGM